jgi:hypothetical protein
MGWRCRESARPPAFSYLAGQTGRAGYRLDLFLRPCGLCFPGEGFFASVRFSRIALAVAFFFSAQFQSLEVLPERFAYQGRTVFSHPLCSLIGGLQEALVEDDLDYLHMRIILHS